MDIKYPLSNDTWDQKEIDAINSVIRSNYFTMGSNVSEYEKKFAAKFGSKFAVMTNSGSSANLIAVASLVLSGRLKRGDEVLVTAVSWSTTYFPLTQYGLKIRFVDIDLNTLNIDIAGLESALTKDTRAVFAVNLLGNPNKYDEIISFCKKHDLILLEDNCESMGAEYCGRKTGTFGLLGSFSSFYSHHIATMEGGMTVTDDEELYHYMLSIRAHGWTRNLPKESKIYIKSDDDFYESFNFLMPGYNLRPLEIEAAIGIEQLDKLNSFIAQRRINADYLKSRISEMPEYKLQSETGNSSWFGFAIILTGSLKGHRHELVHLFNEAGIEVRPIVAGNFTKQKTLKYMDYSISGNLTNADYIHENGFFVGNHSVDMTEMIDYLISVLKSFSESHGC